MKSANVREVEVYFQQSLPPSFAEKIAERDEQVVAARKETVRLLSDWHLLKAFMRHWLASTLANERPSLYRRLPDDFKVGRPLPVKPEPASPNQSRSKAIRAVPFVHGLELLLP
jgi:hypothetical protein